MIDAKLNWHGGEAMAVIQAAAWDGVRRAVAFFHHQVLLALNIPNPSEKKLRTRKTSRGPKGSSYLAYPNPSAPGEPPRKQTGFLSGNVAYELDEAAGTAKVGVKANAKYGAFLELGTKRMAARPFLLATLNLFLPQIQKLAGSGGKR